MPNGERRLCHSCKHLSNLECSIRHEKIPIPYWTGCNHWNEDTNNVTCDLNAIVCEVIGGAGGYDKIPYFKGNRADTFQEGEEDTYIKFDDGNGNIIELPTVDRYLKYHKEHLESNI
jgi:hypothetical protein